MTSGRKVIARIAVGVLGISGAIAASQAWTKEVAMAKVKEFYIPNNFRRPIKQVADVQRGKILEFCPQTRQSA